MQLGALSDKEIASQAAGPGLCIACGPMVTRLITDIPELLKDVKDIYADYPVVELAQTSADICVEMRHTSLLRRYFRRQITGIADRPGPFAPLPPDLSFVGFEMAQNWQIANAHNHHLLFHASSVVGEAGGAILMPGQSGSGKSTLGIALGYRGWRFLGDEFALYDLAGSGFVPLARPASLKNQSIASLKQDVPSDRFSRIFHDTPKGTMAYLRPPTASLEAMDGAAPLSAVVFPRFVADQEPGIRRYRKAEALVELTNACVNFERLSEAAFDVLADWAERIPVFKITYPSIEKACEMICAIEAGLHESEDAS